MFHIKYFEMTSSLQKKKKKWVLDKNTVKVLKKIIPPLPWIQLLTKPDLMYTAMLLSISSCSWCPVRPDNTRTLELDQRKVYCRAMKEQVAHAPQTPISLKGFSKAFSKARWRRAGVIGCCKLLGVRILCSCSGPHRSGHDVPVNLQQDKCYSLFNNFDLYVNGKVLYL